MMREIITPKKSIVTLQLPEEMVGKTVEVIAFEIEGEKYSPTRSQRLGEIENLTKNTLTDLSGFKFDRDKANDYGE
jgi:hypothetical protein